MASADEAERQQLAVGESGDRQDEAVAEPVDEATVTSNRGEPGLAQFEICGTKTTQVVDERCPASGCVPRLHVGGIAGEVHAEPACQVVLGPRSAEPRGIEVTRQLVELEDARAAHGGAHRCVELACRVCRDLLIGGGARTPALRRANAAMVRTASAVASPSSCSECSSDGSSS